ncbi:MAG: DotU/TssL family secretion system protein [Geminicoccaceae bacterium]
MARLLDHFSSLISDVLAIAAGMSSAEKPLDGAQAVRSRLVAGIRSAEKQARDDGKSEQDLRQSTFGVVAWIDEVMLGYPDWGAAASNLQGELLSTQIARETFFENLEQLNDNQDEVREVYYVLLCLGFRGYYGELSEGQKELERLKDQHGRRLRMVPASASALIEERLTAQPYGVSPPPPLPEPPAKKRRRWIWIAAVVLMLLLLLLLGFLLLPWWLERRVAAGFGDLECARVDVRIGLDRIADIDGYVSSGPDREQMLANLDQMFGVAGVEGDIDVHPWPFCEALDVVRPYFKQNAGAGSDLSLGITASNDALKDGEPLILTIGTPGYPAFLYVDYYQEGGDVLHILHAAATESPIEADEALEIDTGFEGAEPYGEELLTIIASPVPLFEEPLPDVEDAKAYLGALRARLKEHKDEADHDSISASSLFIRAEP